MRDFGGFGGGASLFVSLDGVIVGVGGGRTIVSVAGVDVDGDDISPVGVLVTPASSGVVGCVSGICFPHHLDVFVGTEFVDLSEDDLSDVKLSTSKGSEMRIR